MTIDHPSSRSSPSGDRNAPGQPWWRFGIVWLLFAGPAIVVVAGLGTVAIAFKYADVELHQAPDKPAQASPR